MTAWPTILYSLKNSLLQVISKNACSSVYFSVIFLNIQNMLISLTMQITEY